MKYTIGRLSLVLSTCAACSGTLDPPSSSSGEGGTSSSSIGGDTTTSQSTTVPRSTIGGASNVGGSAPKPGSPSNVTSGGGIAMATSTATSGGNAPISVTSRGGNAPNSLTERGGNAPSSATTRGGNASSSTTERGGNAPSSATTRGGNAPRSESSTLLRGGAAGTAGGATAVGTTQPTGGAQTGGSSTNSSPASTPRLPDANVPFDYQIGGAYTPPAGVKIVSRDRKSQPASGLYNICYVNGFQSQPDEETFWKEQHPELLLRNASGAFVVDEDWGEYLLDTSTTDKRLALGKIVGEWIQQCAKDGFDAIEVDNLDSYSRSSGLLNQSQNVAMMRILSDVAHANGLAVAQKNSTELLGSVTAMGTDFAVAEECNRWDECADYQRAYGNRVYVIEYRASDFKAGCTSYPELSIVLRDLNVSSPSSGSYVFEGC